MMTTQENTVAKQNAKNRIEDAKNVDISEMTAKTALSLLRYIPLWTHSFFAIDIADKKVMFRYSINGEDFVIMVAENKISFDGKEYDDFHGLYEASNAVKLKYQDNVDKLCLFTGAFNPPTIAHYHMIETAMEVTNFNYIVFATSNQTFLDKKQSKVGGWAYSEEKRIKMLLAMTKDCTNVLIFGVERGYTYDVLCAVREKYKPKELYFALGSDKLQEIGRWGHHDALLSEFCFYVSQRNDKLEYIQKQCEDLFKRTKFVIGTHNEEYKDVSATQVRDSIENKTDYKYLVTPYVYEELNT